VFVYIFQDECESQRGWDFFLSSSNKPDLNDCRHVQNIAIVLGQEILRIYWEKIVFYVVSLRFL